MLLTSYHPGPAPREPTYPGKRAHPTLKAWYYFLIWTKNYRWWHWYGRYLKSRAWRDKRAAILKRDGKRCTNCRTSGSNTNPLQVHHADYKRARVGYESVDSPYVFTLCRACHTKHHGR